MTDNSSPAGATPIRYWRKKPVVIEAWQYNPSILFPEWLQTAYVNEIAYFDGDSLAIVTLEGIVHAKIGDWVIKGVEGELYPCKPSIFAATYEPAKPRSKGDAE